MDARAAVGVRATRQYAPALLATLPALLADHEPPHADIDPMKVNKPRQFSRSTAPARSTDTSLWTETPAERQQRLADEVLGKKRRIENAEPDAEDEEDARKRRKRDETLKREVEEYTVRIYPLRLHVCCSC